MTTPGELKDENIYSGVVIDAKPALVHITMTAKGTESWHAQRLFILCPVDLVFTRKTEDGMSFEMRSKAVPMAQREKATCDECQLLAAVVLANGLTVKTDPQTFRRKLRSLLK